MSTEISTKLQSNLLKLIDPYFSLDELRTLCLELGVDFDNVPGEAKEGKVRELILLLHRNGRLADLIGKCRTERPHIVWPMRLFISYTHTAKRDHQLADALHEFLKENGHLVFLSGTSSLDYIHKQIENSDYLIVMLSKEAANSELVQAEFRHAYMCNRLEEQPRILLIRVDYEGLPPYGTGQIETDLQVITLSETVNTRQIAQETFEIITGRRDVYKAGQRYSRHADTLVTEDGGQIISGNHDKLYPPAPRFDPRLLEELDPPGGTVRLRNRFYIERDADNQIRRQIKRPGSITTIRASRQTGKSSLMVRGIRYARQQGAKVVMLDLQLMDLKDSSTLDTFLHNLANRIIRALQLDMQPVKEMWQRQFSSKEKLSFLMEDYILPEINVKKPLILAMDEVDRLLDTQYYTEIFGLFRSWYNNAAYNPIWERLNILMVVSTEPYLLITDVNQSPFNVGLVLYLEDFNQEELSELNKRHGSPVHAHNFAEFKDLFSGHPYLTRQALYTLVVNQLSWSELTQVAPTDTGPFGDHLRHQLQSLQNDPALRKGLKQVLNAQQCKDDMISYRLLRAGLIKGRGDHYVCRCDLYRQYFEEKL